MTCVILVYPMDNEDIVAKYRIVKDLLKRIHRGEDIEKLKLELSNVLSKVSPWEIGFIEQMLVQDGITPLEISLLCTAHVELFKDSLVEDKELFKLPRGHPLEILLRETMAFLEDAEKLTLHRKALEAGDPSVARDIRKLLLEMLGFKKHFIRLQMLVFPYLERKGLTAIPRVLWSRQDQLIAMVKKALRLTSNIDNPAITELAKALEELTREAMDMVFRETRILYPTLRILLREGEWVAVKEEEAVIGYYRVDGEGEWSASEEPIYPYMVKGMSREELAKLPKEVAKLISTVDDSDLVRPGDIELRTGYLSPSEIDGILSTLPIDISFIDNDDRLRYYNGSGERIFARTRTVLGRKVDLCHPPKSVGIVRRIIEEFKAGRRDKAEFWINMGGRLIYIRYYPVRDKEGRYLGTLEVVEDITDIKKISGEKRLLDWK